MNSDDTGRDQALTEFATALRRLQARRAAEIPQPTRRVLPTRRKWRLVALQTLFWCLFWFVFWHVIDAFANWVAG